MKTRDITEFKEGIYINKNGEDIVEIVFKFTNDNVPCYNSDVFYYKTEFYSNTERHIYFSNNYLFCCEF